MSTRYQLLERGVFDHQTRAVVLPSDPAWAEYQQWLTEGGVLLPLDPVGQIADLATAKTQRCNEINAYAASLRNKAIAGRSTGEMASWALKLFDAMAVAGSQPSPFAAVLSALQTALGLPVTPTSYNHAVAMVRGITEAQHVNLVLAQAVPFMAAEAAIDGNRGKHCDAINAKTTIPDIVTYDWSIGWPVIPA